MKYVWLVLALTMMALTATQQSLGQSQSVSTPPSPQFTPPPKNTAEIGLVLATRAPDPYRPGDVNVSVLIVNYGNRTVMLPKPLAACQSADGYIEISRELLGPAKYPERQGICVADFFGKRDLLAETDNWIKLAPNGTYEARAELSFDNPGVRYKIRAKYVPPTMTAEELKLLSEHGIIVVQASPESNPLIVKSPNPK